MSYFPISENSKTGLRKQALAIRKQLPLDQVSQQIVQQIASWSVFQKSKTILFYYPLPFEVSLLSLAGRFSEKQWYLPKMEGEKGLRFYRYHPGDKLSLGAYQVQEPIGTEPIALASGKDSCLVMVPGLLFDRQGHRLGYGKGYYDRFLNSLQQQNINHTSLGVVASHLWIEALPADDHDIAVNAIVTESGVHKV